jgi:RNA polymerase sigma factor (sigma-70 family)
MGTRTVGSAHVNTGSSRTSSGSPIACYEGGGRSFGWPPDRPPAASVELPVVGSRSADEAEDLRRVYRTHVRAVHAFLAYSVRADVAEDLTADTFERVIRAWDRFDPARASERTWILSIARNALTDHFRRSSHRQTVSTDEQPALLDRLSGDDALAVRVRVDGVKEWLEQLDERERLLVALRYGGDLTTAEVAEETGLSLANVQQILSRCLRRLRKAAESAEGEGNAEGGGGGAVSDSARPNA